VLYLLISVIVCGPLIAIVEAKLRRQRQAKASRRMIESVAEFEAFDARLNPKGGERG
jgi:hypothetical protein